MKVVIPLQLILILLSIPINAKENPSFKSIIPASVISVYDGDTFRVEAHPWPNMIIKIAIRVSGIDTPEIRGKCIKEKKLAKKAKEFTKKFIGKQVLLYSIKLGKYAGRIVAKVLNNEGNDLSEALMENKLAYLYEGGTKRNWC